MAGFNEIKKDLKTYNLNACIGPKPYLSSRGYNVTTDPFRFNDVNYRSFVWNKTNSINLRSTGVASSTEYGFPYRTSDVEGATIYGEGTGDWNIEVCPNLDSNIWVELLESDINGNGNVAISGHHNFFRFVLREGADLSIWIYSSVRNLPIHISSIISPVIEDPSPAIIVLTTGTSWIPNVTGTVLVECWGGGGGAAGCSSSEYGGGGGGGGGYAAIELSVISGQSYPYYIGEGGIGNSGDPNPMYANGSNGEDTYINFAYGDNVLPTTCFAKGGGGGKAEIGSSENNGGGEIDDGTSSPFNIGTITAHGGSGETYTPSEAGGGGGSSASYGLSGDKHIAINGNNGVSQNGGQPLTYGGQGGNGAFGADGQQAKGSNGTSPGGGGGGGSYSYDGPYFQPGGNGAKGQIIITYPSPGII